MQVQTRPKKTLSLHFRLILGTEIANNIKKQQANKQIKQNEKKTANPVEKIESHLQSCHIIILFIFKYTPSTKYNKLHKEIEKYVPFKVKNKSIETVLEKGLMTDQLNKDFKITVIKLIKKKNLKEDVEK